MIRIRYARPMDVRDIYALVEPYSMGRVLIPKNLIDYFEEVQEFLVAEEFTSMDAEGRRTARIVGCGALHVLWDDIGEVRTLAVHPDMKGRGIGHLLLEKLLDRAVDELGLQRVFCLTFEVDFFAAHGFEVIEGTPVGTDVYAEMLRSHDDGVAEFLELARVKPNTLGNTRMLCDLEDWRSQR